MKTFIRFGYVDGDGEVYVGSDDVYGVNDAHKLRIMCEITFKKLMAEHRMRKRIYDAAMKWYVGIPVDSFDVESKKYLAFKKIMEEARVRIKR
jgi:hypothetical protein